MAIRSISLFAGAGGLDLSFELFAVCGIIDRLEPLLYVENETSAAEILAARIAEGSLPQAHIWSDITKLNGRKFRGAVDLIYGGFPCSDISVTGKQAGIEEGEKSGLWREYARLIREIQPRWVYIENVPGVLSLGNGRAVLGELSKLGFSAEWITVSAADVGASHLRKRVFILAWRSDLADAQREPGGAERQQEPRRELGWGARAVNGSVPRESGPKLADAGRERSDVQQRPIRNEPEGSRGELAIPTQRGRRELRESPGRDGLADGRGIDVGDSNVTRENIRAEAGRPRPATREPDQHVEHAERAERWPHAEPRGCDQPRQDDEGEAASGAGKRSFDLEHPDRIGRTQERRRAQEHGATGSGRDADIRSAARESGGGVGDSTITRPEERRSQPGDVGQELAPAERTGFALPIFAPGPGLGNESTIREIRELATTNPRRAFDLFRAELSNTLAWQDLLVRNPWLRPAIAQAEAEPDLRLLADGLANMVVRERTDALRAAGNGVVAICGAVAFIVLARRAGLI